MPGNNFQEEFESVASIDSSGNLVLPTGMGLLTTNPLLGIGYSTGAGGAITQETNKSEGVTLSKPCGVITMNNAQLNLATEVSFTVTNTLVTASDVIALSIASGASSSKYMINVQAVATDSFIITIGNISGDNLTEAVVINFAIIKGVAA